MNFKNIKIQNIKIRNMKCKNIKCKSNKKLKKSKIIVLESSKTSVDIKYLSILVPLTIFICYIIAVSKGHVKPWLPYISDCAVGYPETYIFRSGMTMASFFMILNCFEFYLFIKRYNKTILPFFSFVFGTISNTGLGGVAVINEKENHRLHIISAFIFFAFQMIYMWLTIINIKNAKKLYYVNKPITNDMRFNNETRKESIEIKENKNDNNIDNIDDNYVNDNIDNIDDNVYEANQITINRTYKNDKKSLLAKISISTIYTIDILYLAINYDKNIPLTEWFAVALIVLYNLSFIIDFKNNLYIGVYLQ
jgi:hypothetical protein